MNQEFKNPEQADLELKKVEEQYRELIEHTKTLIYIHDLQGQFLSINQGAAEFLGYEKDALLKMNVRDILIPEVRDEFETYLTTIKQNGVSKGLMFVQMGTGDKRILEYDNILYTKRTAVPVVSGIAYDITEHINTKKRLKQLSQQFSIILESLPIVSYTLKGEEDYRPTYITHNVKTVTGFEHADFMSKPFFGPERIHPEDSPRILANLPRLFEKGYHEHQYRYQVADGSYKWFYDHLRLIKSLDGKKYIAGMMQDITERKRSEEEIQRSYDTQTIINSLLHLSLENIPLEEILRQALELILSIPWLAFESRGGIFIVENDVLVMKVQKGLSEPIQESCAKVPFGRCLCGKAALSQKIQFSNCLDESHEIRYEGIFSHGHYCVPILISDKILGVINIYIREGHPRDQREEEFLTAVANTLAGIIMRKQTEEALLHAAQQWRTTFDSISDFVCLLDFDGKILRCNKAMKNFLGKPFNEIINHSCWEMMLDTSEPIENCPFLRMKETLRRETTILSMNDQWYNITIDPILDESGHLIGAVNIISDITERKQAEEEMKRLSQENAIIAEIGRIISSTLNIEEVYERFAEEVHKLIPFDRIVINHIDTEKGTVINVYMAGKGVTDREVNKIYPLKGSGNAEMAHTNSTLLIQTEDFTEYKDRYPMLLSTFQAGFRSIMNVPLFLKGRVVGGLLLRSLKPYAYTEKDVRLAEKIGNQIAGAIANAQLFNERKQVEEALRVSETRFRQLFDDAPVGYHEFDAEGRITRVNRTELEMLGYTEEEMLGRLLRDFIAETLCLDVLKERLADKLPPGQAFELTFRRKDKTTFPALIQERFLRDDEGQMIGIRSTIQDITELKQAEERMKTLQEQLLQAQKMEAVGQLAGGVAHDFNNLLTVINGYSDLILEDLDEKNRFFQDVKEIKKASEHAASLTRQLLAFSRKQILQPKVLDINSLVLNMDKMVRRMIGEDIQMVTLLPKDLGRVKVDPGQIEQVILNLAVNARDAMPKGGKLTIETTNVVLDEEYAHTHINVTPGRYVMLSISDNGIGMSKEIMEHIFEPFFTTKETGKGTGLGLSTVYGIIKQSGGNIGIYSEPGQGTTFKIYLPQLEEDDEMVGQRDSLRQSLQGSETILLVEDEEGVRRVAHTILEKNGYTILEATNGEEALRSVQENHSHPIHLLLTDVVMPGMNGRELADQLILKRPDMKILFMSGYTGNAIIHHDILKVGMPYIQKPFTPNALTYKVREILDGRQGSGESSPPLLSVP